MTISWAWIQGSVGDIPTYSAADDRQVLSAIFDEGVVRGCKATGGTPARTVIIGTGQAVIMGDDAGNLGQEYVATITAAETVAIGAAPGAGTRVDLVGLQVQDVTAGGAAGNDIVTRVVVGTVGAGQPATPASFLPICSVTISAGQTAVTAGMVTDLRVTAGPKEPVGSLKWWYGPSSRIPAGWRALSVAGGETIGAFGSFPDLADLLGVTSGNIVVGIPRGRSLIAIDPTDSTADAVGELSGAATVTLGTANMAAHTHSAAHDHTNATVSISDPGHSHPEVAASSGTNYAKRIPGSGSDDVYNAGTSVSLGWVTNPATAAGTTGITASVDLPSIAVTTDAGTGTSTAFAIRPPSMAVHLLIRVL